MLPLRRLVCVDSVLTCCFLGLQWPAPSAARPVAAGRRSDRPPPQAVRDLDRAPPPPPSAQPAQRRPSQPVRGEGASGHPPHHSHMESTRRKTQVLSLGANNSKNNFWRGLIIAPKGAPFIFKQVLKNHGDRTNTSEDINKKREGRAESALPFQCDS